MGQAKKRTAEFKESLFNKHKLLLEIIYYLSDSLMLEEHIIQFKAILSDSKSNTREDIKELLEEGFVKEKQVLLSNSRAIYLTKYPISKIKKIKSRNVTSVRATEEKILNSLFRCEYILNKIIPVLKGKITLNRIINTINSNANTILINKNNSISLYRSLINIKSEKFNNIEFDKDFFEDYNIVIYEKQSFLDRISNDHIKINSDYKKIKDEKDKRILILKNNKTFDENKHFFNFKNFLNRGFGITTIKSENDSLKIYIYYLDLYNTAEVYKIYKSLGYIYQMFCRYFKANIKLHLDIYTYDKKRVDKIKADANLKVKEFRTGEILKYRKAENTLINSSVNESDLKNISVSCKHFDFYNKYKIKK
ncbi:hypothetical protein ACEE21_15000 [Clostridium baratii]